MRTASDLLPSRRMPGTHARETWRLVLEGRVQGVGFRPFVYRLALRHRLGGRVRNALGQVEILVQGPPGALTAFARALVEEAPPLARPVIALREALGSAAFDGFSISSSDAQFPARIFVPSDAFTCDDCLAELGDHADRRYRYPFINCTQCGPRYTLIRRMPYDRAHTSMAGFPLCQACHAEYEDPHDRRFHAEPVACPECGPQLEWQEGRLAPIADTSAALDAALAALRAGKIVAVKGVGGYHLVCDARNDLAVARLRERKQRPHKPLAVMFPVRGTGGLGALEAEVSLSETEAALLRSPVRPIVLASQRGVGGLSRHVAPGLDEIGVFLPYSPLHHLLLEGFDAPLVATSGNLSGEPVLTAPQEARRRLRDIADAFLHHDRPIVRPADDPVFRSIAGVPRPLRLGRGCAPLELELSTPLTHPVLAVGAHLKNTVALAWENRVVVSPHIGDMDTRRSLEVFEQVVEDLQQLYGVRAQAVVCDAHPGYATSRWAARSGLPVHRVLHHHAHASAVAGESGAAAEQLVFAWDGLGLGADGTLWGGETFLGMPGRWQRVASMRSFSLPGGDRASREPWRSALALCWETGADWPRCPRDVSLVQQAWERGLNCHRSSAVGRLFDAAAALSLGIEDASFEGQAPMLLESAALGEGPVLPLPIARHGELLQVDWGPLVPWLLDDRVPAAERAAGFHASLADAAVRLCVHVRERHRVSRVGLSGGVFQNRMLVEHIARALKARSFDLRLPARVPANDGGLSYGQIVEYAAAARSGIAPRSAPSAESTNARAPSTSRP